MESIYPGDINRARFRVVALWIKPMYFTDQGCVVSSFSLNKTVVLVTSAMRSTKARARDVRSEPAVQKRLCSRLVRSETFAFGAVSVIALVDFRETLTIFRMSNHIFSLFTETNQQRERTFS